jgi:hypothetical protein
MNNIVKFPENPAHKRNSQFGGGLEEQFKIALSREPAANNTTVNYAIIGGLLGWTAASVAGPEYLAEGLEFIKWHEFAQGYKDFARILEEDPGFERFVMFRIAPALLAGLIPGTVLGGIKKAYSSIRNGIENKKIQEKFRNQDVGAVVENLYVS